MRRWPSYGNAALTGHSERQIGCAADLIPPSPHGQETLNRGVHLKLRWPLHPGNPNRKLGPPLPEGERGRVAKFKGLFRRKPLIYMHFDPSPASSNAAVLVSLQQGHDLALQRPNEKSWPLVESYG